MAQQTINNKYQGETGLSSRTKINSNFNELYYKSDNIDYNLLKNKIIDFSEKCFLRFDVDGVLYATSTNAKYLFWSSTNADYCIYNPLSDGWNGEIPRIEGRTSIPLTDIPLDIFDIEGSVDDGYIKITNKLYGKCKSSFNIETLVDVIYNVDYKDYPIVDFSNNGKINKSSVEGLDADLTIINENIVSINNSLVPILSPEITYGYTQYTYNLNSLTAVWENDWLVLDIDTMPTYDIKNFKARIEIDNRFVNISPVFSLLDTNHSVIKKIWVRDTDNVLSQNNNLGSIFIQFDLYTHSDNTGNIDQKYVEYGTRKVFNELIPNMVIGGYDTIHENKCKDAIIVAVPEFIGNIYIGADIPEGVDMVGLTFFDGRIADICIKYSADIIAFPQSIIHNLPTAPDILSYHVSPNIMTTLAHWHNINIEHNHFETNTEFYDGVILCGAVVTDFIFHPSTTGYDFDPITHKGLFHYSYGRGLEFVVDFAILYPNIVYNNSYMQLEPITLIPSESYATSIIAAQLKLIKLATKSTWLEVRLAARATASNNGVWDKYKGFGHINVNAAIAYIEANYNNQSIEIGKRYSQEKGYSDKLKYEHIYNNTPIPKRLIEEKLSTKVDLEDGKVISSQIPNNVLLSDGSVQMGTQVQEILSRPFSFIPINSGGDGMSYYANNINLYSGDFRSIFTNGSFIKLYGGLGEYYVVVKWATYISELNMTNIVIEITYTPLPYFLYLVKISNIPVIYTPTNPNDISTKEYVDSKSINYTNNSPIQQALGGIAVGETFENISVVDMFNKLLYPYQSPVFSTFSLSNGITILECGVNWSGVTNASFTFTNVSNVKADSLAIYQDATTLVSAQPITSPIAVTLIHANKSVDAQYITMKVQAENTNNILFNRSYNVTWYMPYYFGVGIVGLDVSAIQSLSKTVTAKTNITKTYNTTNQIPYLAYPTSRGLITSILDKNGYETISDFTRTTRTFIINGISVQYYVYEFNNPSTANNLQITYKY